jgi:hypothetical protein
MFGERMRRSRPRPTRPAVAALVCLALAVPSIGSAQTAGSPAPIEPIDYSTVRLSRIVTAVRTDEPIVLDGRLDEAAWSRARPATGFTQRQPRTGAPASQNTEVRVLYDDDNLYIGAICYDTEPSRIIMTDLREDFGTYDNDTIGFSIDSLHDRRTGFNFIVNPAGAKFDSQSAHDGDQINTDWDAVWDVRTTMNDKGWIAELVIPFKTLRFTRMASQEFGFQISRRLRRNNEDAQWSPLPRRYNSFVRPSFAGTLRGLDDLKPGRNLKIKPFVTASTASAGGPQERHADGGFDLKFGLTPSLTLDGTFRTDFSQVEVDQQQVNLTRFNLFFAEKREFFLENSGLFRVAGNRGGNSAGSSDFIPFFSRRIGLSGSGVPIPILGGSRLTGSVGRYDIGALAMRTEEDSGVPANNFVVGRVTRNFLDNSWIGAIMTHRDSTRAGDTNALFGVDVNFRFFQRLEIASYLMRTDTPDKDGRDQARMGEVAWRDDDFSVEGRYETLHDNFNPEVGFVRRRDVEHYSTGVSWLPRVRWSPLMRNLVFSGQFDYYGNSHGHLETREQQLTAGIDFNNGGSIDLSFLPTFERLRSPFAIRSDLAIAPGDYDYRRWQMSYNSDRSRLLSGNVTIGAGGFWDGDSTSVTGELDLKSNQHLTIGATLGRNMVDLPDGSFSTTLVGARIQYAFTSKMFLNSFLQYNADTDRITTNTRFNLIHRPLSDLYVVYNDQRDTTGGTLVGRALILKFTNMFDF